MMSHEAELLIAAREHIRLLTVDRNSLHHDAHERSSMTVEGADDELVEAVECLWLLEQYRRHKIATISQPEESIVATEKGIVPFSRLGRLELIRELGRGGGGVVFHAYDRKLQRDVALKLPRLEVLSDTRLRQRFLLESRAASRLTHPGIVTVHDAGEDEGVCYIISEYCKGGTLSHWMATQSEPIAPHAAALIIEQLAEALHIAHQHGVLHRDIKPGNILLELPATADHPIVPKLSDFGLAKLLDDDKDATRTGAIIGTPRYMAPEQALGKTELIGTATDIYSLGVVLYELLTRRTPHAGGTDLEMYQKIAEDEPTPPRKLRHGLPLDLEAICLKCLEKSPKQRYASAQDLADDLKRFLSGAPTIARPLSTLGRSWRWAKRRRAAAGLLAVTLIGIILAVFGLLHYNANLRRLNQNLTEALEQAKAARTRADVQRSKADKARLRAETSETRAQQMLYATDMKVASIAFEDRDTAEVRRLLDRHLPTENRSDLREFVWHYLHHRISVPVLSHLEHPQAVYRVSFTNDGLRLATACADGCARIWNVDDFSKPAFTIETRHGECNGAYFSPDGTLLSTTGDDGALRIWSTKDGMLVHEVEHAHANTSHDALFTPDGKHLVSCGSDGFVRIWSTDSGACLDEWENHPGSTIEGIAISPDGHLVASGGGSGDHRFVIRSLTSKDKIIEHRLASKPHGIAFSATEPVVMAVDDEGLVRVWNTSTGELLGAFPDCLDSTLCVSVDRVGSVFIGDSKGNILRSRFDSNHRRMEHVRSASLHEGRVWSVACDPTGAQIATAGADGFVRILSSTDPAWLPPRKWPISVVQAAVSPDDSKTCLMEPDCLSILDLKSGDLHSIATLEHPVDDIRFSADGTSLAIAEGNKNRIRFLDPVTGDTIRSIAVKQPSRFLLPPKASYIAYTRIDRYRMEVIDLATASLVCVFDDLMQQPIAHSPTYDLIAGWKNGEVALCNLQDGSTTRWSAQRNVNALCFSEDGELLITAGDRVLKLWDVASRHLHGTFSGHRQIIRSVTISPDRRTIASGDENGAQLWDVATGQATLTLPGNTIFVQFLAEGRQLLHVTTDFVELIDVASPASEPETLSSNIPPRTAKQ